MSFDGCATIAHVRSCAAALTLLLLLPNTLQAQDAVGEARRLYNAGDFDAAERMAVEQLNALQLFPRKNY